jgi:pimeloyl-ACP methyl ester carboxylesterase
MERAFEVSGYGVRIAAREWPGEGPPFLLLHGLASSSHIWDLVAPRLAGAFRVITYDQRGHGRSGKPSSGYGFDRTSADAVAVMRAVGLDRPVVVGHSWGANVALEVAVRHRSAVSGLVLIDGGFLNLRDRMDWTTCRERLAPPDLRGTPLHEFLEFLRFELGGTIEITPEVEAVFLSLMRIDGHGNIHPRLSRANHLRILRALWEQDTQGLLRGVRVPTLVLAVRTAPDDPGSAGFLEEKRRAVQALRGLGGPVSIRWVDGIHDLPLQRPQLVADRISRSARQAVG